MQPNLGSGSSLLGGGNDALQSAIAARATGQAGPTAAQSPASAGFTPGMEQPILPDPQASPASTVPSSGASSLGASLGMGAPMDSGESQLIIKALDSRLKSLSKLQGA